MSHFLANKPLENVCLVSKQACDIMTPMVVEFYNAINGETSKLKADKSVFTIADGIVQYLLINCLFGNKFHEVIGEEEDSTVNITTAPYTVEDLNVPQEFYPMINKVKVDMEALSNQLTGHDYKHLSVFIDPIDGTREFSTNKGEQCSICIGFSHSKENGNPVAGIVYRPITTPPTWAAGAASENVVLGELNYAANANNAGFLTSNGGISKFIEHLMEALHYERVPSGGAGNKMLMLLEGKGNCYIQDRGVSRWDTCAAQAVIEAYGGACCKLSCFIHNNKEMSGYTYKKSEVNLDFEENLSNITPYNVKNKNIVKKGETVIGTLDMFKPYSNLCGIFAINKNSLNSAESVNMYYDAIMKAKELSPPAYD